MYYIYVTFYVISKICTTYTNDIKIWTQMNILTLTYSGVTLEVAIFLWTLVQPNYEVYAPISNENTITHTSIKQQTMLEKNVIAKGMSLEIWKFPTFLNQKLQEFLIRFLSISHCVSYFSFHTMVPMMLYLWWIHAKLIRCPFNKN